MKLFVLVFGIHVLIQSLAPCSDCFRAIEDDRQRSLNSFIAATEEHDCQECSPFCVFACCGSTVNASAIRAQRFEYTAELTSGPTIHRYDLYSRVSTASIWQPPKA